jgi:putative phosphoribosyl transferase
MERRLVAFAPGTGQAHDVTSAGARTDERLARQLDRDERQVVLGSSTGDRRGWLGMPPRPRGLVLFAHGSGLGSLRDEDLARRFRRAGIATLRCDLLAPHELHPRRRGGEARYRVDLLASRLIDARLWLLGPETSWLPIGYFGTGVGATAALVAATEHAEGIAAIVARHGRVDLLGERLHHVRTPTLLLEESHDPWILAREVRARRELPPPSMLRELPARPADIDASREIASLAIEWFERYFAPTPERAPVRDDVLPLLDPRGRH